MANVTTDQVWQEIEKQLFAILGMVSARQEARTVGIVYVVHDRKLFIASAPDAWKVRHIQQNPNVSMTVPIHKRIPLMPWIKIPSATITFAGEAVIRKMNELPEEVTKPLFRGIDISQEDSEAHAIIEVTPTGHFLTYGVRVSLMGMRDTHKARGRVPVD